MAKKSKKGTASSGEKRKHAAKAMRALPMRQLFPPA